VISPHESGKGERNVKKEREGLILLNKVIENLHESNLPSSSLSSILFCVDER
jgi:hypothetical protein